MNTNTRKTLLILLVAGFAVSVSACRTMHGLGEDTEKVGEKIQKKSHERSKNDHHEKREHDQP